MARTDAPSEFDWTPVVGKALAIDRPPIDQPPRRRQPPSAPHSPASRAKLRADEVLVADDNARLATQLTRIANLMALILVKDLEEGEQIRLLDAVGYSAAEIGTFLNKRPNTVSSALYRQRNPKRMAASRKGTSSRRRSTSGGR
jgi:DNA-directed RNA polymerase specialized sigma24 family protein